MSRGIKKINERILQSGRSLILTEEDLKNYSWDEIPSGTLKINPKTGILEVKLQDILILKDGTQLENAKVVKNKDGVDVVVYADSEASYYSPNKDANGNFIQYLGSEVAFNSNQTTWMPAGIKNEGTLTVAKDAMFVVETFTVVSIDATTKELIYKNSNGEQRHSKKDDVYGCVFELERGIYANRRNHLEVIIDDTLHRSAQSGGVVEIDEKHFGIPETLMPGQEVTAKYFQIIRVGNPYPRVFINGKEPSAAEIGDFWLDTDFNLGENTPYQALGIPWSAIRDKPNTINGYGITDKLSIVGHTHSINEITDLPTSFNIKDAETAKKLKTPIAVSLTGDAVGTVSFDGSADCSITTTVSHAGDSDKLGGQPLSGIMSIASIAAAASIPKIKIVTGTITASGTAIPLPDGYTRDQCKCLCSITGNTAAGNSVALDETTGVVTFTGTGITNVSYILIGVKIGG